MATETASQTLLSPSEAAYLCPALDVSPLTRSGNEVYAALAEPLYVVTSPQKLTAVDLDLKTAHVDCSDSVRDFISALEKRVADVVVANKSAWFPAASGKKTEPEDAAIRARFKSFFLPSGDYRFKLSLDAEAFGDSGAPIDIAEVEAGARVRLVLEVTRVSFGKREYGVSIRIKQLRVARQPVCLIVDDDTPSHENPDYDSDFL